MILKKGHILPFINEGSGVEDLFYGEIANLGYEKRLTSQSPDFVEFEVEAVTTSNAVSIIEEGFRQYSRVFNHLPSKVVAIIADIGNNRKKLKIIPNTDFLIGETIHFKHGTGKLLDWFPVILIKKMN